MAQSELVWVIVATLLRSNDVRTLRVISYGSIVVIIVKFFFVLLLKVFA